MPDSPPTLAQYCTALRQDPWAWQQVARRSRVMSEFRSVLARRGHLEQPPGHRPERWHGQPLALRALVTCGFARVYEISRSTFPGSTRCEAYEADADLTTMQDLAVDLLSTVAAVTAPMPGIVLTAKARGVSVHAAVGGVLGTTVTPDTSRETLQRLAVEQGIVVDEAASVAELVYAVYEQRVVPVTHAPQLYTDFPTNAFPLARTCAHDERLAQRWTLVAAGGEIAAATAEEPDPATIQQRMRTPDGDAEWWSVLAGMPPAAGITVHLDHLMTTPVSRIGGTTDESTQDDPECDGNSH
ncbi:lysyl-tRNA synthetase class II [Saccharopolyspora lacisalsi]|uniref:Lysyl-tRNA synthetase class II n=1 Tax=Halosaccharopolyspora lacisalsi TaxID=1000566 RepID=A0A839E7C8_9PSEU|nr:amino acid--tRNA ligase-related protein [Halosaccharopolyspora lacisalsi]MBA8827815.1 lysyl-tRNA synthetase class II [Halosaccharopolyspora lacisalsi]